MGTKLEGRVALVTGGTKGIGAAIARALLGAGASVVICGRSAESVDQALADLSPLGRVEGRVCDVGRFADVSELFGFANETFGRCVSEVFLPEHLAHPLMPAFASGPELHWRGLLRPSFRLVVRVRLSNR